MHPLSLLLTATCSLLTLTSASPTSTETDDTSLSCTNTTTTTNTSSLSTLPNAYPKQIAASRRRSGLTHHEFLSYITLVHGLKAWNDPVNDSSRPLAYYHNHVFDSVFGSNDSVPDPVYMGRDAVIELYSSNEAAFLGPPSTNYTQTVTGPDGEWFGDENTAFSMFAYETVLPSSSLLPACNSTPDDLARPITAFYWVASSNTSASLDNTTFASSVAQAFATNTNLTGNVDQVSYHTEIPGTDSRLYYGGAAMPRMNAVVKFWLCDAGTAVTALRAAQTGLDATDLGVDVDVSFMVFGREVAIWDDTMNVAFDAPRLEAFIAAETQY